MYEPLIAPEAGPYAPYLDRVLLSRDEIARRVHELGRSISEDYAGREIVLVTVLRGGVPFLADLSRAITVPCRIDFLAISSYEHRGEAGAVRITKDLDEDIAGAHVLLVEDIVDTGLSLHYLLRILRAHEPATLEVVTLLDKDVRRIADLPIAYRGFTIPDRYVVGYGLDHRGLMRNLPYVATMRDEVMEA